MDICNCYSREVRRRYLDEFERGVKFAHTGRHITYVDDPVAICNGTKEREICTCGGNRCKCDFYEDVRTKARQEEKAKAEKIMPQNVELEFYREYIFDQGLMYDALNKYEAWKKRKGIK